jgi:REP element-mobilizing transposase RayT
MIACHLVWTAYGWWFPNDIRGAWSKEVWAPTLRQLGTTEQLGRRSLQPTAAQLKNYLLSAQRYLKYSPTTLDAKAREKVANEITAHATLHNYKICALAVMPDHVHVVVARHTHTYQRIVNAFKSVSARALRRYLGLAASPATRNGIRAAGGTANRTPVWSRGYWVRYLDTEQTLASAIAYIENQRL